MRKPNFVHTSCIFDAEVNIPRRGMRFAGMNPSPIPAKEKALLCDLCVLEGAQRLGVRKKPLRASSLARFARAHRVRREMQNIPSAEIREIIILPTLSAPDGAEKTFLEYENKLNKRE